MPSKFLHQEIIIRSILHRGLSIPTLGIPAILSRGGTPQHRVTSQHTGEDNNKPLPTTASDSGQNTADLVEAAPPKVFRTMESSIVFPQYGICVREGNSCATRTGHNNTLSRRQSIATTPCCYSNRLQ